MVYDPVGDRALYDAEGAIWALDLEGGRWSPIEAVGEVPPPHHGSTLAMDPLRNRVLLFGGQSRVPPSFPALADVWSLDLAPPARWSRLSPSGVGPAPLLETGVYDPVRDRLLVFSSQAFGPDDRSGLFELPLGDDHSLRWNPLATTAPEGTRLDYLFDQVFAYDSRADQLLFFGGGIRNPDDIWSTNGFWNLPLAPPLEWRILSLPEVWQPGSTFSGVSPRFNAAGVYDPDVNRLLVFGGALQSLFGGPLPDDAVAFGLDSNQWSRLEPADGPVPGWGVPAAVYDPRRHRTLVFQSDAVWALASRPRCERDPIRRLATRDAMDAVAGSTLELRGAWPNPSVAGVEIAFALPDNSESSLELVDIAGRRVWSEDVGGLGVGFHRVRIAIAQSLAPGVYLLTLHHGTGTHTTKLVRLAR
jgi:hypothetical protein